MNENSEYHAYVCIDEGCGGRCIVFTLDDGNGQTELPTHCIMGAECCWKAFDDYIKEMKKLKKSLDLTSSKIEDMLGVIS